MKIQILVNKELSPIVFERAIAIIIDNKQGLRVIGPEYKKIFPLESITSVMAVENESCNN